MNRAKSKIFLITVIFAVGVIAGVFMGYKHGESIHRVLLKAKRVFVHGPYDPGQKQQASALKNGVKDICDFEQEKDLANWEKNNIQFERSIEHPSEGRHSLKVVYPISDYPGISSIYRLKPEDWSKFKLFKLDVYNPREEQIKFCVIIKDKEGGDAYPKRCDNIFLLNSGINRIAIDLSQLRRNDGSGKLNSNSIIQYVFCLIRPNKNTTLYLDNIRLENAEAGIKGDILVNINAQESAQKINPLIFGANLAAKSTADSKAVSEFARSIGITIFRFPAGDAPGYHWRTGTYDFWTKKPYMFFLSKYDNIVQFCRETNTKLLIQVNLESGTPQEAAEWVEYTNKKLGFYVEYWELGNEAYGKWDNSHRKPEEYAKNLKEYSIAMKAADPTIKLGADWAGEYFGDWDKIIMKNAGEYIDFLSYHWYPNHTNKKMLQGGDAHPNSLDVAANAFNVSKITQRMKSIIKREYPAKEGKIEFSFLEWDGAWDAPWYNPEPYEQGVVQWSLANALFHAESFAQFIQQGVDVSTIFQLQETPFGLIRGHLTDDPVNNVQWDGKTIRPKAFAIQMFRKHFGSVMVKTDLKNSPKYIKSSDWYDSSYTGEVPYLSCYASKNESGDKLYIMLINRHPHENLPVDFKISGFSFKKICNIWKLTGPEITSQNDGSPGQVGVFHETAEFPSGVNFKYICPAHSVVSIELDKESL